jgi:cytochrome c553
VNVSPFVSRWRQNATGSTEEIMRMDPSIGAPIIEMAKRGRRGGGKAWRTLCLSASAALLKIGAFTVVVGLTSSTLLAQGMHGPAASPSTESPSPPASPPSATVPEASPKDIDGETMFATSCGWCHQQGGRAAGRGPKLAGIKKDDAFIINRIKHGKPGTMPAFGRAFSDSQIIAIVAYIRSLDDSGE